MSTPIYFPSSGNPAIEAGPTSLAELLLARFDTPEIDLEWTTNGLASAKFRARELPPEVVVAGGETLGVTIGNLAARAWLYEFTRKFPSASVVQRYTSYERDLTYGGNTYSSKRISHGEIQQGLALDTDEVSIDVDGLDVAPIMDTAVLRLEAPLFVSIIAAEIVGDGLAGNTKVLWTGEVADAKVSGRKVTSKAISGSTAFDRKAPSFYLQPGCNFAIFSPGCGLDPAAWVHTATMNNPGTPGWPFTFVLSSLARAGGAALTAVDAFAGGWFEFGSGTSLQRLPILASTAVSAGSLTITLSRDPTTWVTAGTSVRIYPGCDGSLSTCRDRFSNLSNFGGHPFVPTGNPSLIKLSSNIAGGGKK